MADQLTSVRFDEDTLRALKALAALNDSNLASEIRSAVAEYLQRTTSSPEFPERVRAAAAKREEQLNELLALAEVHSPQSPAARRSKDR